MPITEASKAHLNTPQKLKKFKHIETPTKSRIRTLYSHGSSQQQIRQILKQENNIELSQSRISRIINNVSYRRTGYNISKPKTRGRKKKFSKAKLDQVEKTLN